MNHPVYIAKYIGREYEEYNCFDLAKEFYADVFGLELKNYFEGEVPRGGDAESLIISNKGDFVQVDCPHFGDLIVIKLFGYASHIGVYLGEGKFLHSVRTSGSCMDRLARYSRMIEGYYRHRERVHD